MMGDVTFLMCSMRHVESEMADVCTPYLRM